MVDHATRYPKTIPLKKVSSETVAEKALVNLIAAQSNRGNSYTANEFVSDSMQEVSSYAAENTVTNCDAASSNVLRVVVDI